MNPYLEWVERERLLTRLVNDIQLLLERRSEKPQSLKEVLKDFLEKHPRPENGTLASFLNPFEAWFYGHDTTFAWCDEVPEERPKPKGMDPLSWCMNYSANRDFIYYDFEYTDFERDPARGPRRPPACVPKLTSHKVLLMRQPKPVQKYPEKIIGVAPEQMERLLEELKHI